MDDDTLTTLKILIIGESGVGKSRDLLINKEMSVWQGEHAGFILPEQITCTDYISISKHSSSAVRTSDIKHYLHPP
ncbi:hypothetical protein F2P81_025667 [Scophthalmus maximus]|uniref:Uncharacterized protein n=1 Tax=Scophthalmus maximus TaxID=52904 RepID=A0A6A4RRU1_SCOMX|nr:hypothetical protein F2P81_025667 [Scophthalmus maximus]